MTHFFGRNINKNDTATQAIIELATTSTDIASANEDRIYFRVDHDGPGVQPIYIKLQAASVDDLKVGMRLGVGEFWEMPTDNIYTGPISAIAAVDSPCAIVTEY